MVLTGCQSSPPPSVTTATSSIPAVSTPAVTTATTATMPPATTTAATPSATAPAGTTAPSATPAQDTSSTDLVIAARTAGLFTDLILVQDYYTDGLNQMTTLDLASTGGAATAAWSGGRGGAVVLVASRYVPGPAAGAPASAGLLANVPTEFLEPLPANGAMPAPPGACPAAAKPEVIFENENGEAVTPELITGKGIETIPSDMVTVPETDPGSLMNLMKSLVPMGDTSLASPDTWNRLLWEPLAQSQVPAASLMDDQVWTTSDELERLVVARFREELAAGGAPAPVLAAFDASNNQGWYGSRSAGPGDGLARMDIVAEMTGSVNGIVEEERDFHIPGLGQAPVYGVQTGSGVVTGDVPDVGPVDFSVDISLDRYDSRGRAVGGTVAAVAGQDTGYEVTFTFLPDGTKEGIVVRDGERVGELTMAVDHDNFENYVDLKKGTTVTLPEFATAD
jgi:hypothetical protein